MLSEPWLATARSTFLSRLRSVAAIQDGPDPTEPGSTAEVGRFCPIWDEE